MLFTIWFINFFLSIILYYKNSKFKYLIDDIANDLWPSLNFASIEDIRKNFNPIMDLSKFTFNEKILSGVVAFVYNQICCENLSIV